MATDLLGQVSNLINNSVKIENSNTNELDNNVTVQKQNNFLESSLGKVVNVGIDLGLRAILPDVIENQVIDIKNAIFNNGFKEGLNQAIKSAIDLGKSAIGIFTGKFENISQVQDAVRTGGIIDSTSNLIDWGVRKAQDNDLINASTATLIRQGKNLILSNVEKGIEVSLTGQLKSIEKINKYTNQWQGYYNQKDMEGMEREYQKIRTEIKNVIPLETTITESRKVENLHKIIKSKGFDLSDNELELANRLI